MKTLNYNQFIKESGNGPEEFDTAMSSRVAPPTKAFLYDNQGEEMDSFLQEVLDAYHNDSYFRNLVKKNGLFSAIRTIKYWANPPKNL